MFFILFFFCFEYSVIEGVRSSIFWCVFTLDLFTKKGASTLFRWQWRFVSSWRRQYPHVFYICFHVHFYIIFLHRYLVTFVARIYSVVWLTTVSMPLICVRRMYTIQLYFQCQYSDPAEHYDHTHIGALGSNQGRNSSSSTVVVIMFCLVSVFCISNLQIMKKKRLCLVHGREVSWNI